MTKPVMHVDREVEDIERFTGGAVEVVGPDDSQLAGAAAAIVGGVRWDAARFDLAPDLTVLARTGIGYDAVDLAEATSRSVMVVNTPDGPTVSTAEHTMALLFTVAKTIGVTQDRLRRAVGNYHPASTAIELDGLTLGLLAYGRIARRVAAMAAAVGMEVIVCDPYLDQDDPSLATDPARPELVEREALFARSDVLSLHCPLTPETERIMNAETFSRCKPGVVFLNAARGGLVDHDALVAALDSGQVQAAGLDVTDPEPLDPGHTLLDRENVVVTPHVASATKPSRERMLRMAIEQALLALDGKRPTELVNPEVWPLD